MTGEVIPKAWLGDRVTIAQAETDPRRTQFQGVALVFLASCEYIYLALPVACHLDRHVGRRAKAVQSQPPTGLDPAQP